MYVQRTIEMHSCFRSCSGKTMSIKKPECVHLWP